MGTIPELAGMPGRATGSTRRCGALASEDERSFDQLHVMHSPMRRVSALLGPPRFLPGRPHVNEQKLSVNARIDLLY